MAITNDPVFLFQNQTSNITTSPLYLDFSTKSVVQVWGTWNGATVVLQEGIGINANGNITWVQITDRFNNPFTFSVNTTITLTEFIYLQPIRAVLSNAGASTNLNCVIQAVGTY